MLPAGFWGDLRGGNDGTRSLSFCLGGDQRRERASASHFQSADIPNELTRVLNLHDRVSGSNASFLLSRPNLIVKSKVIPSNYFFLLDAESWPAEHNTNNTASSNGEYRDIIRFIIAAVWDCCQQNPLTRWNLRCTAIKRGNSFLCSRVSKKLMLSDFFFSPTKTKIWGCCETDLFI